MELSISDNASDRLHQIDNILKDEDILKKLTDILYFKINLLHIEQ